MDTLVINGEPIPNPLPPDIQVLRVTRSPTTQLPPLPFTIREVYVNYGQISSLAQPDISHLTSLETLDLSNNDIGELDLVVPSCLAVLNVSSNQLTRIEVTGDIQVAIFDASYNMIKTLPAFMRPFQPTITAKMRCNPLWYIEYSDIPRSRVTIETMAELCDAEAYNILSSTRYRTAKYELIRQVKDGEVSRADADLYVADILEAEAEAERDWEDRQRQRLKQNMRPAQPTTYENKQNVHLSSNQAAVITSVRALQALPTHATADTLIADFTKRLGKKKEWVAQMLKLCKTPSTHSILGVTYKDVMALVLNAVYTHPDKAIKMAIHNILKDEIKSGLTMCFTGQLSRMVNALSGYMEGVGVHQSSQEELSNAIIMIRRRLADMYGLDTDEYLAHAIAEVQHALFEHDKELSKGECDAWIDAL
jgi:polyhydroxyalkanoate synthesis regulator phasin